MKPALKPTFQSIIAQHLTHYTGLGIQDVYKLVFQAAMGSEHAVDDADLAERHLRSEAETMVPAPGGTPMIDPVLPDHRLVRVNLRPFTAGGGDLGRLATAFIETSRVFKPSKGALSTYWEWVEEMAESGDFPFTYGEVSAYGRMQRLQQYPAVHHSPAYRRLYQPAYRVVLKDRIELPGR